MSKIKRIAKHLSNWITSNYSLWDVDPATTDEERAAWNVPPLAEALQLAEELTRRRELARRACR
jgi:hypothetical protein